MGSPCKLRNFRVHLSMNNQSMNNVFLFITIIITGEFCVPWLSNCSFTPNQWMKFSEYICLFVCFGMERVKYKDIENWHKTLAFSSFNSKMQVFLSALQNPYLWCAKCCLSAICLKKQMRQWLLAFVIQAKADGKLAELHYCIHTLI